jgi:hypothetical protein
MKSLALQTLEYIAKEKSDLKKIHEENSDHTSLQFYKELAEFHANMRFLYERMARKALEDLNETSNM